MSLNEETGSPPLLGRMGKAGYRGDLIVDSQEFGLLGFQKLGAGCLHTGQNVYLMRVTLFLPLGHPDTLPLF